MKRLMLGGTLPSREKLLTVHCKVISGLRISYTRKRENTGAGGGWRYTS